MADLPHEKRRGNGHDPAPQHFAPPKQHILPFFDADDEVLQSEQPPPLTAAVIAEWNRVSDREKKLQRRLRRIMGAENSDESDASIEARVFRCFGLIGALHAVRLQRAELQANSRWRRGLIDPD